MLLLTCIDYVQCLTFDMLQNLQDHISPEQLHRMMVGLVMGPLISSDSSSSKTTEQESQNVVPLVRRTLPLSSHRFFYFRALMTLRPVRLQGWARLLLSANALPGS